MFLTKIGKNARFLHISEQNLTNYELLFCAFGRKPQADKHDNSKPSNSPLANGPMVEELISFAVS